MVSKCDGTFDLHTPKPDLNNKTPALIPNFIEVPDANSAVGAGLQNAEIILEEVKSEGKISSPSSPTEATNRIPHELRLL